MKRGFDIVERGAGPPLVVIPGIQGRWEYATATVDALARHFKVITFSLCDERTERVSTDVADRGPMDVFADHGFIGSPPRGGNVR